MFRNTVDLNYNKERGFGYWSYNDASAHRDLIWSPLL